MLCGHKAHWMCVLTSIARHRRCAAWEAASARAAAAPWWAGPTGAVLGGFVPSARAPVIDDAGAERHVIDGLSLLQGPNYALAKTLQHWRAVVARADGAVVSANMAPPARTESMLHNSQAREGTPSDLLSKGTAQREGQLWARQSRPSLNERPR